MSPVTVPWFKYLRRPWRIASHRLAKLLFDNVFRTPRIRTSHVLLSSQTSNLDRSPVRISYVCSPRVSSASATVTCSASCPSSSPVFLIVAHSKLIEHVSIYIENQEFQSGRKKNVRRTIPTSKSGSMTGPASGRCCSFWGKSFSWRSVLRYSLRQLQSKAVSSSFSSRAARRCETAALPVKLELSFRWWSCSRARSDTDACFVAVDRQSSSALQYPRRRVPFRIWSSHESRSRRFFVMVIWIGC